MSARSRAITFVITDLHRGGSPLVLADLAPALAQRGLRVEVVSIAPRGEIAGILKKQGVRVISLEARSNRDWKVIPRFAEYLRMRKPGLVCSILVHANLLVALSRPLVENKFAWVQSIHTVQEKPQWHWWAQAFVSPYADATIAPSRAVISKMEEFGPVPRPVVIPNGIDVSRFRDAAPMGNLPWPSGSKVVGYIGRFDPVKRLDRLIGAMPYLPSDVHLALVGYGGHESELRGVAQRFHGRVHFVGVTAEPERWYKVFNVFCSPSASEGFGLTLAEAAVSGLPVVSCATSAVCETLPEVEGLPWDPSPRQIAAAVRKALIYSHPIDKAVLTDRYSKDKMVAAYERLFRSFTELS